MYAASVSYSLGAGSWELGVEQTCNGQDTRFLNTSEGKKQGMKRVQLETETEVSLTQETFTCDLNKEGQGIHRYLGKIFQIKVLQA